MSNNAIVKFTIQQRINDPSTNMTIDLDPAVDTDIITGEEFNFTIIDTRNPLGLTALSGQIQTVKRDGRKNNSVISLTGRDNGLFLVKQPYARNCSALPQDEASGTGGSSTGFTESQSELEKTITDYVTGKTATLNIPTLVTNVMASIGVDVTVGSAPSTYMDCATTLINGWVADISTFEVNIALTRIAQCFPAPISNATSELLTDAEADIRAEHPTATDEQIAIYVNNLKLQLGMNAVQANRHFAEGTTGSTEDIINHILENTGIEVARGQSDLSETIVYNTIATSVERYCGEWKTKKEAIDQLFLQYQRMTSGHRIRWYIDLEGYMRWFEIATVRGRKHLFMDGDPNISKLTFDENAENIINDVTVVGGTEAPIKTHVQDHASIERYGLQIGDPIKENRFDTKAKVDQKAAEELRQKSKPIYTASMTIQDFFNIEPGEQAMWPDNPDYGTIVFTLVDKKVSGTPASYTTELSFTTDESVISIANEFDIVDTVASTRVNDAKSQMATVVAKPDPTTVIVKPDGSDNHIVAKLPSWQS